MTGYGHGVGRGVGFAVEVEISSVNRRQLDIQCALPRSLQVLESRILEEIGSVIQRGRIAVNVRVRPGRAGKVQVHVREAVAESCLKALRTTARKLDLPDDLTASVLANWPEVLVIFHPEDDAGKVWPTIREGVRAALSGLMRMRVAEGATLVRDLLARLRRLRAGLKRIGTRAPGAVARYRLALQARIRDAGVPLGDGDDRLLREIALFADRADISEELTRLSSHLDQFESHLKQGEGQGRSLEFLAQELLREINTLTAKAADTDVLREAIVFKTEIESLREQVQNIE